MSAINPRKAIQPAKGGEASQDRAQFQRDINEIVARKQEILSHIRAAPSDALNEHNARRRAARMPDAMDDLVAFRSDLIDPVKKLKDIEQPIGLADAKPSQCPHCGGEIAAGDQRREDKAGRGVGLEQEHEEVGKHAFDLPPGDDDAA